MPFTPVHFGPGVRLKSTLPHTLSLATFVAVQVIVDIESLYHLLTGKWPIHTVLHSLIGGTAAGILAAIAVWLIGPAVMHRFSQRIRINGDRPIVRAEFSFAGT